MLKKLLLLVGLLCCFAFAKAQWIELGTGANALNANGSISSICKDRYGNVYAGGNFTDSTGTKYVANWNGDTWGVLGSGTIPLHSAAEITTVLVDGIEDVYILTKANTDVVQYAVYWNSIGQGFNDTVRCLFLDKSSHLYAAGDFVEAGDSLFVAEWDRYGSGYFDVDSRGISNYPNAYYLYSSIYSIYVDSSGNIYGAGTFYNAKGYFYVAKFGRTVTEVGNNGNSLNANGYIKSILLDKYENIYAAGNFTNDSGKYYVAKWNGTNWIELGSPNNLLNANRRINQIVIDTSDNIYAAGEFTNTSGKYYVAKWNGIYWSELGAGTNALNANNYITSIAVDDSGNVYAAGAFTNSKGNYYVAKYSQNNNITGIASSTNSILTIYPNPTNSSITLTAPEAGQATIYNLLGEAVATQNVIQGNNLISFEKAVTGVYTLILTGQNGNYTPVKIIKD